METRKWIAGMLTCAMTAISFAADAVQFKLEGNPIFRDAFTADPAPLVVGDTLYVYVGHDEAKGDQLFNITEWLCYSTRDMQTWTAHGSVLKPTDFKWAVGDAWASQVIEKDGKFYFYTTVQHGRPHVGKAIGVAVSDSPTGPFVDARGSALVFDSMTPSGKPWDDIDPTVLIDDDGTAYMAWGNPYLYFVKLKPNLIEIDGAIETIDLPYYTEGPWFHKRGDIYYLTYPAFAHQGRAEKICYATAPAITGPWTYRGVLTGSARNSYTIHPGIVEFKGQWYFFYHNATLTLNGLGGATGRRSVCVEYLYYNPDGTLQPITQTREGISVPATGPKEMSPDWTNPIVPQRADPHVFLHDDGYYYMAATVPSFDRVELRRARTIGGLATAEPKVVWTRPSGGLMGGPIWAPEIHFVDGKWYVYISAGEGGKAWDTIRPHALVCTGNDPLNDTWEVAGRILTQWDTFSLDATIFEHEGQRYFVWCQVEPDKLGTNIMIAKMKSPTELEDKQVILSRPEYPWEQHIHWVNEAPAALVRNNKVFIAYSASATDANYCMGLLTANADADLLDPKSWSKSKEPVFKSSDATSQYGPGHNSFTTTPDGKTVIMVYHSRSYKEIRGSSLANPDRHTRAQIVNWKRDGTPDFGVPVPDGSYYLSKHKLN